VGATGVLHRPAATGSGRLPGPFKGPSREHSESDLRCYLSWCAERGLDPLAAQRPHLELYIRWMHQAGADWNRYAADIARSRDHQP